MFTILGKRGCKLCHLTEAFEKLNLQKCLKIIGIPRFNSFAEFAENIELVVGSTFILHVKTNGFPYPKHIHFKNNKFVHEGNPFIIENLK
jgi:hypothetical protein